MSIPKICPLAAAASPVHMAKCREDCCAWWDPLGKMCCMVTAADGLREVGNQLTALTIILEDKEEEN